MHFGISYFDQVDVASRSTTHSRIPPKFQGKRIHSKESRKRMHSKRIHSCSFQNKPSPGPPPALTVWGSEAGSYLRLIDFVYHSTLGLRVITKKKITVWLPRPSIGLEAAAAAPRPAPPAPPRPRPRNPPRGASAPPDCELAPATPV